MKCVEQSNIVHPPRKEKQASASAEDEDMSLVPGSVDRSVRIRIELTSNLKHGLTKLLVRYANVFAWRTEDMTWIPRSIIEHHLNINPSFPPIKYKKRIIVSERNVIVNREVVKLVHEVYVDDMEIKIKEDCEFLKDVEETLIRLRDTNMMLNPKKCIFGVQKGKLSGHIVSSHGINDNPNKVNTLMSTRSPRTVKEAHSLNGKMVSLGRFLAKSAEQSLPFFQLLKDHLGKGHHYLDGGGRRGFGIIEMELGNFLHFLARRSENLSKYTCLPFGKP